MLFAPVRPNSARSGLLSRLAHGVIASPIWVWFVLDGLIALAAIHTAHCASPWFGSSRFPSGYFVFVYAAFALLLPLTTYALGSYERTAFYSRLRAAGACLIAPVLALGIMTVLLAWLPYLQVGRYIMLTTLILACCSMGLVRLIVVSWARQSKLRVAFFGTEANFRRTQSEIFARRGMAGCFELILHVQPERLLNQSERLEVENVIREAAVDKIIVEDDTATIETVLSRPLGILTASCFLRTQSDFHESLFGEVLLDSVDYRALLGGGWALGRPSVELPKRLFDVMVALTGLLIAAPVMLIVAVLVKLTSRGPVFYTQSRVGRFDVPFTIYKFRTMRTDAEANGVVWAKKNDNRTTPIGALLRKSRLDELPQLWNILRGQMSFVGPRPERPEFVAMLEKDIPFYHLRHLIPPGLTGWAQIKYRYGASVEDSKKKLSYDLYYVKNFGVLFDFGIFLRTFLAMAKGAR